MNVLLGPAHFGNMHEAFDAFFQFHKRAVIGDVGDTARYTAGDRIFHGHTFPRILLQLLHAERDALGVGVDLDDLDLERLTHGQHVGRMVHALPADVGDMQEAVNAAQIHERAVIGDVLDDAINHLAFGQVLDDFRTLFGAGFFHDGAAGDNDVAATLVHLQDLEGLSQVHQRADIPDRTHVHLASGQEGHSATKVNRKAALDATKDDAVNALVLVEHIFKANPGFFTARLVARQHGFTERIFHALQIDFHFIAGLQVDIAAGLGEFLQRHAAFHLQANVDDDKIIFDRNDATLDDRAFLRITAAEGFIKHCREIIAGRVQGLSRIGHGWSSFSS